MKGTFQRIVLILLVLVLFSVMTFAELIVKEKDFTMLPLIKLKFGSQERLSLQTTVLEDGKKVQVQRFEMTQGGMVKPVDIVFVIDTSGSMDDKVEKLKNSVRSILSIMTGMDYRVAVTGFGDSGSFKIYKYQGENFVNNASSVEYLLELLLDDNFGGDEAQIEALYEATKLPFKSNALRLLIMITDEDTTQSSANSNLYNTLIRKISEDQISVVCLLGSYDTHPATKDTRYSEISQKSGGYTMDLGSSGIESSMRGLAMALTDEYYLEYYTNCKFYDGRTTKITIGNQSMSIQIPERKVSLRIRSNMNSTLYVDSTVVGQTNQYITLYESTVPVNFRVGDQNMVPREFSSVVRNMDPYYELVPRKLSYVISLNYFSAIVNSILIGVTLGGPISLAACMAASMFFDFFDADMIVPTVVIGATATAFVFYRALINTEKSEQEAKKASYDEYNLLVQRYFEGRCSYNDLISKYNQLK